MTDNLDIYRAAKLYIDQHGDQAALQARVVIRGILAKIAAGRRPRKIETGGTA